MVDDRPKEERKADEEEEEEHAAEGGAGDDEEDDDDKFVPGKQVSLQEQLEMDKDDESLRKWKEQLLGNIKLEGAGSEPEVRFVSMQLLVAGRDALELGPFGPFAGESATQPITHFILKEKSVYRLQFKFTVYNELLSGLTYVNFVYRMGVQVDKTKLMMGSYSPQGEAYEFITEEETTPHGILARGKYSAKTAFIDDDGRTHLAFEYTFEIKKDW